MSIGLGPENKYNWKTKNKNFVFKIKHIYIFIRIITLKNIHFILWEDQLKNIELGTFKI